MRRRRHEAFQASAPIRGRLIPLIVARTCCGQRGEPPQRLLETVSLTEGTSATNCFAFRAALTFGQSNDSFI